MQTSIHVVSALDVIAMVTGLVGTTVTVLGFFASLKFYLAGQRLQATADRAVGAILEKSWSIESRVGGLFEKTLDAALTHRYTVTQAQASAPLSADTQELMNVASSQIVLEEERNISEELTSRAISPTDTVAVLIRHLASTRTVLLCEFVYRLILGSQIALLRMLNEFRYDGLSDSSLAEYFEL